MRSGFISVPFYYASELTCVLYVTLSESNLYNNVCLISRASAVFMPSTRVPLILPLNFVLLQHRAPCVVVACVFLQSFFHPVNTYSTCYVLGTRYIILNTTCVVVFGSSLGGRDKSLTNVSMI